MMDLERFRELINIYGANERRWPAELREDMQDVLASSEAARIALVEETQLDAVLDGFQPATADLSANVMESLPGNYIARFVAWLTPDRPRDSWRPAMAATLPLLLGIVIGVSESRIQATTTTETLIWDAQEQAILNPLAAGVWNE